MKFRSLMIAIVLGVSLFAASDAQAAPAIDGVFDLPAKPVRATMGPDSSIWVTLDSADPDVARVSPDGTVTPYSLPTIDHPVGITAAIDGYLWVTGATYVARFLPSNPGGAQKTTVAELTAPNEISPAPDKNLWTASHGKVFRITPNGAPVVTAFDTGIPNFDARGITGYTDSLLWIANADTGSPGILSMDMNGAPGTQLPAGGGSVVDVAGGPNLQTAYTNPGASPQTVGLINSGFLLAPFSLTTPVTPTGIALGDDGAYWIAQSSSTEVGRYTPAGVYTSLPGLPAGAGARGIAKGKAGTMWVTLENLNKIARISGVSAAVASPSLLTHVTLTNKRFRVGRSKTPLTISKRRVPKGTLIKYLVGNAASTLVTIDVDKAKSGRLSGKTCVKPTPALKNAKKCDRWSTLKTLRRRGMPGINSVSFSGRIGNYKFAPGRYRFGLVVTNDSAYASSRVTKSFTIVK